MVPVWQVLHTGTDLDVIVATKERNLGQAPLRQACAAQAHLEVQVSQHLHNEIPNGGAVGGATSAHPGHHQRVWT